MATADPPEFDAETVAAVAADHALAADRLQSLLGAVQRHAESTRGVEDLVFEYRKAFAGDTVAARTETAYFLLVPPHVWPEYGDLLDCSAAELDALKAVHARRFAEVVGAAVESQPGAGVGEPLVLGR